METLPFWGKYYIGIPFVSGGRSPETGLDCYGLFRLVQNNHYGKHLPLLADRYSDACDHRSINNIYRKEAPLIAGDRLPEPVPGCAVVMRYGGMCAHLGVYLGCGYVLHTVRGTGSILEAVTSPGIRSRIEGYYSVRD